MTSRGKRVLRMTAALGLILALSACHYHYYGGHGYRGGGGYYGHGGGHGHGHGKYKRGHW